MDVVGRVCRTHHVSHTAFRGFGGPQGMLVIEEIVDRVARAARSAAARRARAQLLPRRATTTHYGQVVRRSGAHRAHLVRAAGVQRRSRRAGPRSPRSTPASRARQARARDHAGEVRHLVHDDVLQPGRRAGARLPRRQRAGEPRRHRDGAGPAHEDAADRRRRARRAARRDPADADPHRQGAEHVGDRGVERLGSERRGGAATRARRSASGSPGSPRRMLDAPAADDRVRRRPRPSARRARARRRRSARS